MVVSAESAALMTIQVSFPDWGHPVVLELSTTRTPRRPAVRLMAPLDLIFLAWNCLSALNWAVYVSMGVGLRDARIRKTCLGKYHENFLPVMSRSPDRANESIDRFRF